jgi:hypothetical protein
MTNGPRLGARWQDTVLCILGKHEAMRRPDAICKRDVPALEVLFLGDELCDGGISCGWCSHFHALRYISLATLHTKQTGWHGSDSTAHHWPGGIPLANVTMVASFVREQLGLA